MFSTALKEHKEKYKQIGLKIGMRKEVINTALKLLAKGADIQFITTLTGLSAEEIEQLKLN